MAASLAACSSPADTPGDPDSGTIVTPPDPCEPTAAPGVCPGRGLVSDAVRVEIRAPEGASAIYYTTDGSVPTVESGTRYTGPITIDGTPTRAVVVLRAAGLVGSSLAEVATHSYVFSSRVLQQPAQPPGVPDTWGVGDTRPGDYEMDSEVLVSGPLQQQATDALGQLPLLLVTMRGDDLWGSEEGIYMHPELEGLDWERAATIELIEPTGDSTMSTCGIRIQGGSSTQSWKAAKLSMRLLFKSAYGPARFNYPLFPDSSVTSFNTLVLDAHLNHTFVHPSHDQRVRSQYLRDAFTSDLQNAAGSTAPHSRFVHVFLNGLYWGMYDVHERPDGAFAASYLGATRDQYEVVRHDGSTVVAGDGSRWNSLMGAVRSGLVGDDAYAQVKEHLDVDDFIDYMLINAYVGNTDWPRHNWYATSHASSDGRYRFHTWDAEHTLKSIQEDVTTADDGNSPGEIFQALLANASFRQQLSARADELYGAGGALYVNSDAPSVDDSQPANNRPGALYQARADAIRDSVVLEAARWGDNQRDEPYTLSEWDAERDWLIHDYFPARSGVARGQLP